TIFCNPRLREIVLGRTKALACQPPFSRLGRVRRSSNEAPQCSLLAQSGHARRYQRRLPSEVNQTLIGHSVMSGYDPYRESSTPLCCDAASRASPVGLLLAGTLPKTVDPIQN